MPLNRRPASRLLRGLPVSALCLALFAPVAVRAQQGPPPAPLPAPVPAPSPSPSPQPQNPRRNPRAPQPAPQQPGQPGQTGRITLPNGQVVQVSGPPRPGPRPYAEIITKEAKTTSGLVKTHQVDDKVYFEIPANVLNRELLWVTTFARTQTGYGYGGTEVQNRVVRWEKRGDKILLRNVDYQTRAAVEGSFQKTVELANLEPILLTFDVKAYGPNAAPVVDVTPILINDVSEFSPKKQLNAIRLDPSRSFIEKVKAFPTNVEMNVLQTYIALPTPPNNPFGGGNDGPSRDTSTDAVTVVLHHSLLTLPEKPMKPRLEDDRVGFFTTGYYQFGGENRVKNIQYINRWRLEKKDPTAALSEPVKPITYYLAPEVPEKWRPYLKKGVEAWNEAFAAAGFKNAIVCKDAPTAKEDPDFDADDVRYSVIRWLPSSIENAYGPSVVDPRTGEILNADIKLFHNALKLAENWYFVQASPNNPRAQRVPLPDDLMGDCIAYILSHEVGHTLGFPHNMKASSAFSVAQLRDPAFTKQWGTEASIMDYGRFNYVAQPGDGASLIPKIGPYDLFAVQWGYMPIDTAKTPEAEKETLNRLAQQQITNPMLRFGHGPESSETRDDPGQRTEDLGADAIEATRLGLLNIDRVMGYVVPATSKAGENYDRLSEMFDEVLGQRQRELSNVVALVGGYTQTTYHYGQAEGGENPVFTYTPAARQKAAVQFLNKNAFATPRTIIRPEILSRIEPSGVSGRVLASQLVLLNSLMSEARATRLVEQEATAARGQQAYTLAQMMTDVQRGVWGELYAPQVAIDPYRRNLQRAYITLLTPRLTGGLSESRPVARGVLTETKVAIKTALARTTDPATRMHLIDCNQALQDALYPKS